VSNKLSAKNNKNGQVIVNNKVIKKREREIKNTKIYTGSPFLKGYGQSFVNKQIIPLKRS